ncbi:MAG: hypothetical protein UT34_C0002G0117 [candidate division WS6 bacterium GW2011_GWF2_39_15]|uniref:Uncharacterized protein n=1 Tax=candidate division WS6 bacterium GW2011_GWF2_39_15 TaxID=1619100 RepID=A0A0G0Q5E3_9BACT|nr:MAG: hypothetical protein UT34_C0002G0117 [candidate division WS6 bacterium GW2011_GWF2_39_15]
MPDLPYDSLSISFNQQYDLITKKIVNNPWEVEFSHDEVSAIMSDTNLLGRNEQRLSDPYIGLPLAANAEDFVLTGMNFDGSDHSVDALTSWALISMGRIERVFLSENIARDEVVDSDVNPGQFLHGLLCEYIVLRSIVQSSGPVLGREATPASLDVYKAGIATYFSAFAKVYDYQRQVSDGIRSSSDGVTPLEERLFQEGYFDDNLIRILVQKSAKFHELAESFRN